MIKKGFTVLETIIAIAVVSLAIAGATSAVRTGLVGTSIAKEQVKAFYLAQEAIEILRNKRDGNILSNLYGTPTSSWLQGIAGDGDPCGQQRVCTVDATTLGLSNAGCTGWDSCPYLTQNSTTFLYGYDPSWITTPYRREVQIECAGPCDAATEVAVSVQVSWSHGTTQRSFKTKTILANWF